MDAQRRYKCWEFPSIFNSIGRAVSDCSQISWDANLQLPEQDQLCVSLGAHYFRPCLYEWSCFSTRNFAAIAWGSHTQTTSLSGRNTLNE